MSNLDFKRMVYLFVFCKTLFPSPYCSVSPQRLSFSDDMKNFEKYPWVSSVSDEIHGELDLCKGSMMAVREGSERMWVLRRGEA